MSFNDEQAKEVFAAGEKLFDDMCYADAITKFSLAIKLAPDFADAYCLRGECFHWLDKHPRELRDAEKAARLAPDSVSIQRSLGFTYLCHNNTDSALEAFNRALQLAPESADIMSCRALAHKNAGDYVQAIEDYTQALAWQPSSRLYLKRAEAYFKALELDAAIQDCTQAIFLLSDGPSDTWLLSQCYHMRAEVYDALGKLKEQVDDFDKLLEIEPNSYDFTTRALLHMRSGDMDAAKADIEESLNLVRDDPFTLAAAGEVHIQLGDYERAYRDYTTAISLDKFANFYVGRAEALQGLGRHSEALGDLTRALRTISDAGFIYELRAKSLRALGYAKEADKSDELAARLYAEEEGAEG